ncbi:MAG: hypothetical protein R2860_05140 [Desulfobacterales bacterium]
MAFKRHQINRRVIDDLKNRSTIGMYFYLAITIAVLATDDFYKNHVIVFRFFHVCHAIYRRIPDCHHYLFDKIKSIPRVNNGIFSPAFTPPH